MHAVDRLFAAMCESIHHFKTPLMELSPLLARSDNDNQYFVHFTTWNTAFCGLYTKRLDIFWFLFCFVHA